MKRTKSLRQLAKEMGVSTSYLSQVKHGKRPASQKVLSSSSFKKLSNVKQKEIDRNYDCSYNAQVRVMSRPSSSMVEQPTCNR